MQRIIAIVGMPGAGKSETAQLFSSHGYQIVRFGKVTDLELQRRGLLVTEENERKVREELRKRYGMAAYARRSLPGIQSALKEKGRVVIDGLYSWEEYDFLKSKFRQLLLVAVHASPAVRHRRLTGRSVRGLSSNVAAQRDYDELSKLNKAAPIAMADWIIDNSGSLSELKKQVSELVRRIEK